MRLAAFRPLPLFGAFAILAAGIAIAYNVGPPPDRVGLCFAGPTCKDANCHDDYPLRDGSSILKLELLGPPPAPLPAGYRRGELYRLLLSVVDPDPTRGAFGFELASTPCPELEDAGELGVVDPQRTRLTSDGSMTFLEHACPGFPAPDPSVCGFVPFVTGENSWEFTWRPRCDLLGPVNFHYTINAVNWNGMPSGDIVYFGWATLPPPAVCPAEVGPLYLVKADCDPASPGVLDASLSWTSDAQASGYAVHATQVASSLGMTCATPPFLFGPLNTACDTLNGPGLLFYRALGLCGDGSPGPLR